MCEFSQKVPAYKRGLDSEMFVNNSLIYDAALRNIERIGEAATHLPFEVREAHPEIPWRQIIAMRIQIAHAYLGLDDDVIWYIFRTDIPILFSALRKLLATAIENST
ncbi:MAG: DUF86 domain-containing protein [Caldilineaceae bacterium]|nr:DUF86 domain-containing protein [Caldilineaceae bacterium]